MIDIAYCSTTSTSAHDNSHILCPVLRAALATISHMTKVLDIPISKDIPTDTTNKVLGNAYTLVIALYLSWVLLRTDDLTFARLLSGTAVAILLPLILYIPLASILAPKTEVLPQVQHSSRDTPVSTIEAPKKERSPSPRSAKTSSTPQSVSSNLSARVRPQATQHKSEPCQQTRYSNSSKRSSILSADLSFERHDSMDSFCPRKLFHSPTIRRMRSVSPFKSQRKQSTIQSTILDSSEPVHKKSKAFKIKRIFSLHKDGRRQSV